jgi:hypothetical protein
MLDYPSSDGRYQLPPTENGKFCTYLETVSSICLNDFSNVALDFEAAAEQLDQIYSSN